MAPVAPRIKLYFEGSLGQHLVEHNLQKCWYQLPAVISRGSKMQTVTDLITQIRSGFSLLGEVPSLRLELDEYTILEGSSLDVFRDGDIVTVKASQAALPLGQTAGSKRHRSEDSMPAFTADANAPDPERPKKKRKVAKAAAEGRLASGTAAAQLQSLAGVHETEKEGKKKRKRKSTEGQEAPLEAETGILNQPTSPQEAAGNSTEAAAGASGADANCPAPTEQTKQSRSARRKQLKRRFRRLGVAPPPQDAPSSSLHQSAPANPSPAPVAAATVPSSSDPSAAQTDPEVPPPGASAFPPPPKRLKTQPGKLKAQGDGHVYFAESGSESDSAQEDHATHAERAGKSDLHVEEQESSQNQSGKQLAASKQQKAAKEAAPNGLSTRATPEKPKPRPELTHQNGTDQEFAAHSQQQGAETQGTGPSMPLPKTEADHAALPVVEGHLQPGALVAYKLLEIGPDWAPQVSEWRQGEVAASDASGSVVIKPLAGQGQLAQAPAATEEEEEDEEGPPSNYDEEGVLRTELSSLSELRLIRAAKPSSATDLHTPTSTATPTETITTSVTEAAAVNTAAALEAPAGDSSAAAAVAISAAQGDQSSASRIPNIGAWAELSNQIARRKAELAKAAGGSSDAANGLHGDGSGAVVAEHQVMNVTGMQTPGAARPRGGVRASAMGPMLAFLRSSGGLDGSAS